MLLFTLHPHRQYPRICIYLLLLGRVGGLVGRIISSPLKALMANHHALFYSDEIKLTDIELRSRDYLIIPQTIIHSLQSNHTRCRNYIFLFLKYHSRRIHLYPHRYHFIVLHRRLFQRAW